MRALPGILVFVLSCAGDPCAVNDEHACRRDSRCLAAMGTPEEVYCRGQWKAEFVACIVAPIGCDDAETWAQDPSTGRWYVFPNGCVPPGPMDPIQKMCPAP